MSGNEFACSLGSSSAKITWVWTQKTRWKTLANNARRYSSRVCTGLKVDVKGRTHRTVRLVALLVRRGGVQDPLSFEEEREPPHSQETVHTIHLLRPNTTIRNNTWHMRTPVLSSAPQVLVLTKAALVFLLYYSSSGVSFILEACKTSLPEWKRGILLASSLEEHYTKVILIFIYYNSYFY